MYKEKQKLENWNDILSKNKMISAAVDILKMVDAKGYQILIVGGTPRDLILNAQISDIDIATNMPIDALSNFFKVYEIGNSKDFGIVVIKYKKFNFEIANFRTESEYTDKRHPDNVNSVSSFKIDALRRDFKINSLGVDYKGNIYDYTGGMKDIKAKKISSVGDPYLRLNEDALRIIRLVRFAARLDFDIDPMTLKACKRLHANLRNLPTERIKDELWKAASLGGEKFARYIVLLDKLKVLKLILPELVTLKYLKQDFRHHPEGRSGDYLSGSVWNHIIVCLSVSRSTDPIINMAILLHDIGKSTTLIFKDGLPRYYGHDETGIEILDNIAKRLRFSKKETEAIRFGVQNHMRFHKILEMKKSKVYEMVTSQYWDLLTEVGYTDEASRAHEFEYAGNYVEAIQRALNIKEKWLKKEVTPKLVDGNLVMELTGLPPSPMVGRIINEVSEWMINKGVDDLDQIKKKIIEVQQGF